MPTIYWCLHQVLKANLWQFGIFFSAAPTAQNSPELKIHIRNVTQSTSAYYYCGMLNVNDICGYCN